MLCGFFHIHLLLVTNYSPQRQEITQHWKVWSYQKVGHSQVPSTKSVYACVIHQSVLRLRVNKGVIREPLLL